MRFKDGFLAIKASGLFNTEKTVMDGRRHVGGKDRRAETTLRNCFEQKED